MSNQEEFRKDEPSVPMNENIGEELPSDIFEREVVAQKMSDLICDANISVVSPATLQGPWGSGKTVHAMRIVKYINSKRGSSHMCVYWNAAQSDLALDPLPIFVAALSKTVHDEDLSVFEESARKLCGRALMHAGANIALQMISGAVHVDLQSATEAASNALKETNDDDEIKKQFHEFLIEAKIDQSRIEAARLLISTAANKKQLIIIIDELDRCRPDYALRIVECTKHFFQTANCKFLFVLNKDSIISSISHIYGLSSSDATMYINKYIKLDLYLPSKTLINTIAVDNVAHYYDYFIKQEIGSNVYISAYTDSLIASLASKYNLQLREIEKLASMVRLFYGSFSAQNSIKDDHYIHSIMLFVAFLASFRHDVLEKLYYKTLQLKEILEAINCNHASLNTRPVPPSKQHENFFIVLLDFYLNDTRQNSDNLHNKYENTGYEDLIYNHVYQYVLDQTVKLSQYLHV